MPEFKKLGLRYFQTLCTLCSFKLFLFDIYLIECIFSIYYIEKKHFVTKQKKVLFLALKRKENHSTAKVRIFHSLSIMFEASSH